MFEIDMSAFLHDDTRSNVSTPVPAMDEQLELSDSTDSTSSLQRSFPYAKSPLYKTELCRTWRESGSCRYGLKCQFAHGEHELREVQRHPRYKTELCRTFAMGFCPYGHRCRFIHASPTLTSPCSVPSPPRCEPAAPDFTTPHPPAPFCAAVKPGYTTPLLTQRVVPSHRAISSLPKKVAVPAHLPSYPLRDAPALGDLTNTYNLHEPFPPQAVPTASPPPRGSYVGQNGAPIASRIDPQKAASNTAADMPLLGSLPWNKAPPKCASPVMPPPSGLFADMSRATHNIKHRSLPDDLFDDSTPAAAPNACGTKVWGCPPLPASPRQDAKITALASMLEMTLGSSANARSHSQLPRALSPWSLHATSTDGSVDASNEASQAYVLPEPRVRTFAAAPHVSSLVRSALEAFGP